MPYETDYVLAKNRETGEVLEIAFEVPLGAQLTPGTYSISEYTTQGHLRSYDIIITHQSLAVASDKDTPSEDWPGSGCAAACSLPCVFWGVGLAAIFSMKRKDKDEKCG